MFTHIGKFRPVSKLKYRGRSQKSWLTPTSKEPELQFRGTQGDPYILIHTGQQRTITELLCRSDIIVINR